MSEGDVVCYGSCPRKFIAYHVAEPLSFCVFSGAALTSFSWRSGLFLLPPPNLGLETLCCREVSVCLFRLNRSFRRLTDYGIAEEDRSWMSETVESSRFLESSKPGGLKH